MPAQLTPALPFIVAEISCNWINGELVDPAAGLLSVRFERVVNVNACRGYRLRSFQLHRQTFEGGPALIEPEFTLNETIVAVFERDVILQEVVRATNPELGEGV